MSDVKKPEDVANLFIDTCARLRALGATYVSGFGLTAHFGPAPTDDGTRREREKPAPLDLTPDEREYVNRLRQLAKGGSAP